MIIFRYLARQVGQATGVIALILLGVAVISRFAQYLGEAASGQRAADALVLIMLFRLPEFLLVILPLAFLLGIVLSHGRMHADHEMVTLMGAGFGSRSLLRATLGIAVAATVAMAALSLFLAPWGMGRAEAIMRDQEQLTELDLIIAGQFRNFGGDRTTWTEGIGEAASGDRELRNVFVAVAGDGETGAAPVIVLAETARAIVDPETGARFMRLDNVAQYDGEPGAAMFTVGRFDSQSILLPAPAEFDETPEQSTIPTSQLIGSPDPSRRGELQWRLTLIPLALVLAVVALPLSRVQPRQGRYLKLVPAALLYVVYFATLEFCRDAVADGASPYAFWLVHGVFLSVGLLALEANDRGQRQSA